MPGVLHLVLGVFQVTFGSLFAGIGGIDLGLERAGMTCKWQVENDDYCLKVLQEHWPDVPKYGDVRSLDPQELETVDLVAGGFPCQPASVAGKRQGKDDKRWLWDDMLRIVCKIKPRWVLAENVPGLLSAGAGRLFGEVVGGLASCGYDCWWDCIPAAAVGAHHRRDRVFIVAYTNRNRCHDEGSSEKRYARTTRSKSGPFSQQWADKLRRLGRAEDVADATGTRWAAWPGTGESGRCCEEVANADRQQTERFAESRGKCGAWPTEPDVGRVAHGIPSRVDRLKCLGNAVVPQVAEVIGRMIMEADK